MANVHKDFHGALSFGLQFLAREYGEAGVGEFLAGLATTVYKPLVEDLRARGLPALHDHWQRIFKLEGGGAEMTWEEDTLVLTVAQCPAVCHMQAQGYAIAERYCEHTRIVNKAMCQAAGYAASLEYDQAEGRCVQRFWKEAV